MIYKYYQEGTRLLGPSEISWEKSRIVARIVSRRTPGCQPPVAEQEALYAPASRGLEAPRSTPFRESVSEAAFTVPPTDWTSVPSFVRASRGVGGARHHEHHGEDGLT